MVALLLLAACNRYGAADTAVPATATDPWADDDALPVEDLRLALTTPLEDAEDGWALVPFPDLPALLLMDRGTGSAHVFDARYRHAGQRYCLELTDWDHLDDGTDRQGTCDAGEAEIRPGELSPPGGLRVAVPDPANRRAWLVSGQGDLLVASVDLVDGHPLDVWRPTLVAALEGLAEGATQGVGEVAADGTLWVALGEVLYHWDTDGALLAEEALPGDASALVLVDDRPWVTTSAGLWTDGALAGVSALDLVADDADGAWVTTLDALVHLPDGETVEIDATGPLARDPVSGRLYVATADGIAVVEDGVELTRFATAGVLDLAANGSHEVSAWLTDGSLAVYVDDASLAGPAPLGVAVAAFFENPRKSDQAVACDGQGGFMGYLDTAAKNRAWLDDLGAAVMMGVTPEVARTATRCETEAELAAIVAGARTEPGVLFHEQPTCGGDQGCLEDDLAEEAADFAAAGLAATWSSGAPTWDLDGEDWVAAIAAVAPPRVLFFGLSFLPEIPQEDPRGKEPWPWLGEAPPTAWRPASAAAPTTHDDGGTVVLYPGNNVPAFMLGQCPNLPVRACDRLGQGGGAVFDADDVAVLDLLVHRALARRSDVGPDTWSFHLPAIEKYDYTEACTATDRTWSGDACEAALLQTWLHQTHRRYVIPGLATWTLPSELPSP